MVDRVVLVSDGVLLLLLGVGIGCRVGVVILEHI